MMSKADLALYRAKEEGRNQFRFHGAELDKQGAQVHFDGESVRRRAHDEQRQGGRTGKGTTREQVQEDLE